MSAAATARGGTKPVALVTGATRGIGQATAVRLARDGFDLIVNHPGEEDRPEETIAAVEAVGGTAVAMRADVASVGEIDSMFDQVEERFGCLDVLVNNAGTSTFEPFFEITEQIWDQMHAVNLRGAFFCSKRAARLMLDGGRGGRIVSIASISAHVGGRMEVAYCPTKSGLISLMQSLCLVLGPHGITCNCVSPGTIATAGVARQMKLAPDLQGRYEERIPIGRLGTPEEIAAAVAYLASPEASYVNGAEILVDGGMLANPE
ncbi:MAG TPA: 3-oxoacyl-ACP reductase family protein [Solirubrobacterales bacterium]